MERRNLSVESAIRSATSLPAQILGLRTRGLLREGFYADLVVLDLKTLRDRATFFEPHQYAEGIKHVFVSGISVVENDVMTGRLPGTIITPKEGKKAPETLP